MIVYKVDGKKNVFSPGKFIFIKCIAPKNYAKFDSTNTNLSDYFRKDEIYS